MLRSLTFLLLFGMMPFAAAADPAPVEKQLAIQQAMASAQRYLQADRAAKAVEVLEAELSKADGNKAFLALLEQSYLAELSQLAKAPSQASARISQIQRKLDILSDSTNTTPPPPSNAAAIAPPSLPLSSEPTASPAKVEGAALADAVMAFKKKQYQQAERLFAAVGESQLNADQQAAWAYCRIRLAADKVNATACDSATAAAAEKEVQEALKLVPQQAELNKLGQQVMTAAALRITSREPASRMTPAREGENAIETPSFRVRYIKNRELAESIARAAENYRKTIFERWSGPSAGSWEPKCEIVIHPSSEAFAHQTHRPEGSTGIARVRLNDGRALERQIDLRADDATIAANTLPRELTHVVLADLFPDRCPPKWAEEGMAVLAGTAEEIGRYRQTLPRCLRTGDWIGLMQLLEMKEFPAEKITGFYCESVSLTEYLVRLRGERDFTLFLRDCQRYGTAQSLRRQYGIDGIAALESAWKRAALEIGRGQAP